MASISNLSAFTVTVPGYRGKDKTSTPARSSTAGVKDAEAYMRALIGAGADA